MHKDLYNAAISNRKTQYERFKRSVDYFEQQNCLPAFKVVWPEYKLLGSHALQATLERVDIAYQRFFARIGGYPKFKSIRHYSGWTYPDRAGWAAHTIGGNGYLELSNLGQILRRELGWVSYPNGLKHLVSERWEPESWFEESEEESREEKALLSQFVAQCLQDCLDTQIGDVKSPRVLFMAEAQNTRRKLPWIKNSDLSADNFFGALKTYIKNPEDQDRLWFVRLRVADEVEVPSCTAKNSEGSRANGVFQWQGVCDEPGRSLYLSIGKLPNSAKFTLRKAESRLDSAKRPAGNARPLEIAVVHHPGIESDLLAHFVHSLRKRWPYFADAVSLPLPFPFATKAKEYAVSARDNVEAIESNDSEE